jgi:hypothetical protein
VKKWNKEKESSWEIENIREERQKRIQDKKIQKYLLKGEFKRKLKGNTNSEEKV